MSQREVVIVDAMRSPFGRMGGSLRDVLPNPLAATVIKGLLAKTKILEKGKVDALMLGSAFGSVNTPNMSRWVTIAAGLPLETTSHFLEMQCGSSIDTINHSAWKILANQADIIIAGGSDSHSNMSFKFSSTTQPYKQIPPMPVMPQLSPNPEDCIGMGITAENLGTMYKISREASDDYAYQSQMRAKMAMDNDYFKDEIVPITIPGGKKKPDIIFDKDEHPRPETTMEGLAKLPPAFKKDGQVTAGNSSGLNDGCSMVLIMSSDKAKELGYKPMAKWICGGDYGVDPKLMGIGPAYAIPVALKRAGLKLKDLDVMECNEAFAVQQLAVIAELEKQLGEKVDRSKWNMLGGAIAYGHPNGASGARIGMFAMRQLIRTGGKYGMFSTCVGGGLGIAAIVENLQR
ncbi:MAG: thiolase family protein [Dehalococcoidia bacterium]|nr:thiolase family protein [Dehalococcoidia bacterium]